MARENQGLQITLIVFVMLTIILGVTTYLFYRQYDETLKAKLASDATATKNEQQASSSAADVEELKRLIGAAKTESVSAIADTFKKDMENFGATYPEESRFYRNLLEKMQNTINEKNAELTDVKSAIPKLTDDYQTREAARTLQVKQFEESSAKAKADLEAEQAKYQGERERINRDKTEVETKAQAAQKEADAKIAKAQTEIQKAKDEGKKKGDIIERQAVKIESYEADKIEGAANGEITWVNQRNSTVWLNLGRADALMRQVTFSVYPADLTNLTIKGKKASIEVTQILGDHLAEARVLEDDIANPITPGDKIYTPLWNPGAKRHFALAGLLDLDGDGKSDLQTVMNLIAINGGVVDCYVADSGKDKNKQVGRITVNTNCLILGERPTEGNADQIPAFSKVMDDAKLLRLQTVQLADMLQRMGWKNLTPVVRFGRGANPKDFRAKSDDDVTKKSTGTVSSIFQKRDPMKVGDVKESNKAKESGTTTDKKPASSTTPSGGGAGMYHRF